MPVNSQKVSRIFRPMRGRAGNVDFLLSGVIKFLSVYPLGNFLDGDTNAKTEIQI